MRILVHDIRNKVAKLQTPEQWYEAFEYHVMLNNFKEAEKIAEEMLFHTAYDTAMPDLADINNISENNAFTQNVKDTIRHLRDVLPTQYDLEERIISLRPYKFEVKITKKEGKYEDFPGHVGEQIEGTWVHMLPLDPRFVPEEERELLYTRVVETISTNGEICASDFLQGNWYHYYANTAGVIFQGIAEHLFNRDVCSWVNVYGERSCDKNRSGSDRAEAWINPQRCNPIAIVVHPDSSEDFIEEASKIAEVLGLQLYIDKNKAGSRRYLVRIDKESSFYTALRNFFLMTTPTHIYERADALEAYLDEDDLSNLYNRTVSYITEDTDYAIWYDPAQEIYEEFKDVFGKAYSLSPDNREAVMDNSTSVLNMIIKRGTELSASNSIYIERFPLTYLLHQAARFTGPVAYVFDPNKMSYWTDNMKNGRFKRKPHFVDDNGIEWYLYDDAFTISYYAHEFITCCV